jgi:hypothetical protein
MSQRIIEQIDDSLFYRSQSERAARLRDAEQALAEVRQQKARLMRALVRLLSACNLELAVTEDAAPEFRERVLETHAEVAFLAGGGVNADSAAIMEDARCTD